MRKRIYSPTMYTTFLETKNGVDIPIITEPLSEPEAEWKQTQLAEIALDENKNFPLKNEGVIAFKMLRKGYSYGYSGELVIFRVILI